MRPLAQVAAGRELQERHDQAARQGDDVARRGPGPPPPAPRRRRASPAAPRDRRGRAASSQAFSSASTFCPNAVPRLASRSQDRRQPLAVGALEPRPGPHEPAVVELEHAVLLRASARARPAAPSARRPARRARRSSRSRRDAPRARGLSSRCSASIASLVCAPARLKNTAETRSSVRSARSIASMVLAKLGRRGVGGDGVDVRPRLGERRLEGRREVVVGDRRRRAAGRTASSSPEQQRVHADPPRPSVRHRPIGHVARGGRRGLVCRIGSGSSRRRPRPRRRRGRRRARSPGSTPRSSARRHGVVPGRQVA